MIKYDFCFRMERDRGDDSRYRPSSSWNNEEVEEIRYIGASSSSSRYMGGASGGASIGASSSSSRYIGGASGGASDNSRAYDKGKKVFH